MKHRINHLAIIMDGNARWAKINGVSKAAGHKEGARRLYELLPVIADLNIPYVTVYAFSSENWNRPYDEIAVLLKLLNKYVTEKINFLIDNGIRLRIVGNLERIGYSLSKKIEKAVSLTEENTRTTLCIAFGYGGREEIINACREIRAAPQHEPINEENFALHLYDPAMPDVDLLIRTSGVYRISNFLLWHSAYAELYFLDKNWPDFKKEDLMAAIADYSLRIRNFGGR